MRDVAEIPKIGDVVVARTGTVRTVIEVRGLGSVPNPSIVFRNERNGVTTRKASWLYVWTGWVKRNAVRIEPAT